MTFVPADADAIYRVPIEIPVPGRDLAPTIQRFVAHCRLVVGDAYDDLLLQGDEAFVEGVLVDWEDVRDAAGEPMDCTAAARAQYARIQYFAHGFGASYLRFITGLPGKTSAPSLGSSSAAPAADGGSSSETQSGTAST